MIADPGWSAPALFLFVEEKLGMIPPPVGDALSVLANHDAETDAGVTFAAAAGVAQLEQANEVITTADRSNRRRWQRLLVPMLCHRMRIKSHASECRQNKCRHQPSRKH